MRTCSKTPVDLFIQQKGVLQCFKTLQILFSEGDSSTNLEKILIFLRFLWQDKDADVLWLKQWLSNFTRDYIHDWSAFQNTGGVKVKHTKFNDQVQPSTWLCVRAYVLKGDSRARIFRVIHDRGLKTTKIPATFPSLLVPLYIHIATCILLT